MKAPQKLDELERRASCSESRGALTSTHVPLRSSPNNWLATVRTIDIVEPDVVEAVTLTGGTYFDDDIDHRRPRRLHGICASASVRRRVPHDPCSNACSNAAVLAAVRECSPSSTSWVTLRIRS
jgi:hypothetical protein